MSVPSLVAGRLIRAMTRRVPVIRDLAFLLAPPPWPDAVPRPVAGSRLGANYDTSWARTPFARAGRSVVAELVTKPMLRSLCRPTIVGLDRLNDLAGPVVFAANHLSHFDTTLLLSCLPPRFRHRSVVAAGADYFFEQHWKAIFWAFSVNIIPIDRTKVGRRSAELAARLVNEGWSLVIFPEGTRSRDGFMGPFRGGAAYIALRCNAPVVPVHIEGTGDILGAGSRRLRPGKTRVTIGEPITASPDEKSRDFNARIERAVAIAADESRADWWTARRRSADGTTPSLHGPPDIEGWRRTWLGTKRDGQTAGRTRTWPY